MKLKVNVKQRKIFDEWLHTSNYVYNKTVSCINDGEPINFMNLRNKLVTANTKKNNTEYINLENNMRFYKEEKKKHLLLLAKVIINDINNIAAVNLLIKTAEENYQVEKEKLRVVKKSLKSTKNEELREWETKTPKEIRAGAVNDVCKAYQTGFTNLELGHIKHFRLGFRRKQETNKCLLLSHTCIKNNDGILSMAPTFLKDSSQISMGKKTIKKH